MRIDGISTIDRAAFAAVSSRATPPIDFAATLQRHLAEPRAAVAEVRAAIDAIRNGAAIRGGSRARTIPMIDGGTGGDLAALLPDSLDGAALLPYGFDGLATDPFGWRALSRRVGDELVAPGFGTLFERQIAQESGFSPDVAFGLRVSSAGAEGLAQLMPEYYPGTSRDNPEDSLVAGALTMRHYLTVFDGDVRSALAAYNSGLGRVQALQAAHGDNWERALPAETKGYLAAILGTDAPRVPIAGAAPSDLAVFGGRGPGGVLTAPLDRVFGESTVDNLLNLLGPSGMAVRAPAQGHVVAVRYGDDGSTVVLDHGNGWQTSLRGLSGVTVEVGAEVRRGETLGVLAESAGPGQGRLRFGVSLRDQALDPRRYLLPA